MKRFGASLAGAIAGYMLFAAAGYWLTGLLTANVHDASLEAAMTSAFIWGPLGALAGIAVALVATARGPVVDESPRGFPE